LPLLKFSEKDTFVASNSERPILFAANMFAKIGQSCKQKWPFCKQDQKKALKKLQTKDGVCQSSKPFLGLFSRFDTRSGTAGSFRISGDFPIQHTIFLFTVSGIVRHILFRFKHYLF